MNIVEKIDAFRSSVRNRERYDERTTYKDTNVYHNGRASRPLIEDEWTKVSRRPISTDQEVCMIRSYLCVCYMIVHLILFQDSYARRTVVNTTISRQEHQV